MKTTLEKYCELKGWQRGTIKQVQDDYLQCDNKERGKIFDKLIDSMPEISDYELMDWFVAVDLAQIKKILKELDIVNGKIRRKIEAYHLMDFFGYGEDLALELIEQGSNSPADFCIDEEQFINFLLFLGE